MAKLAVWIKDVSLLYKGRAILFRVYPPVEYGTHEYYGDRLPKTHFVVASAIWDRQGNETCIFPSDRKAKILFWQPLEGSQLGEVLCEDVMVDAGYELTYDRRRTDALPSEGNHTVGSLCCSDDMLAHETRDG